MSFTYVDKYGDYFQFYIQDEKSESSLAESWTKESSQIGLAINQDLIGVGTARNNTVPVMLKIHDSEPDNNFDNWDKVYECSIDISSGCLVIAGCTDYFPTAARVQVQPHCYRARIYYGGLKTVVDEFGEGEDHYKVVLWPAPPDELKILKQ